MYAAVFVLPLFIVVMLLIPASIAARYLAGDSGLGSRAATVRAQLVAAVVIALICGIIDEPTSLLRYLGPIVASLIVLIGAIAVPQLKETSPQSPQVVDRQLGTSSASSGRRQVSLQERSPWRLIPRWAYLIPGFGFVVMACTVVFFGLTSTTNDAGQYRVLDAALSVAQAGTDPQFVTMNIHGEQPDEYPGWYVGIPVMIMAAIVGILTVVALYRIANQPLRGTENQRNRDLARRRSYSLIVVAIASSGLLLSMTLMSIFAGAAAANMANFSLWDRELGGVAYAFPALGGLGVLLYFAGLLAGTLAITLLGISWKVARREPQH